MGAEPKIPGGGEPPPTLAERVDDLMWRLDDLRHRPVVAALTVSTCVLVAGIAWWSGRPASVTPIEESIPQIQLVTTVPSVTAPPPVIVHVAGAVVKPGVYQVPADARLVDAIEIAGGTLAEAEPDRLNLAAPVVDGMQIWVPVEGEVVTQHAAAGVTGDSSGPINLNTASAEQLDALAGVGPSTAAAIMAYREDNGPFLTVDDLLSVPGIGPAKLEALRDAVVAQ